MAKALRNGAERRGQESAQVDPFPLGMANPFPTHSLIDQVRDIPLCDVLHWHGFDLKPEGISFRARNDRHNIVVTGNCWFDNKAGRGEAGAIDLQMHLSGKDFLTTCQTLASDFQLVAGGALGLSFPPRQRAKSEQERKPFHELAARYAVPDEASWPIARTYLIEKRKLEPAIVDQMHEVGSIYANDHRPNPSLVFLHRTPYGKVEGATLRDTRHESTFRPCLGNKLSAWFSVGHLVEAHTVVAVESPIDALSYYNLYANRYKSLAAVSCGGATVPHELMHQASDRRQSFVVALDNDSAGQRGWSKAWNETADWNGFKISPDSPKGKDWNDDLIGLVHRLPLPKPQQSSSLRL